MGNTERLVCPGTHRTLLGFININNFTILPEIYVLITKYTMFFVFSKLIQLLLHCTYPSANPLPNLILFPRFIQVNKCRSNLFPLNDCMQFNLWIYYYLLSTLLPVPMLLLIFLTVEIKLQQKKTNFISTWPWMQDFSMMFFGKWNCWVILYARYCKLVSKMIILIYNYSDTLRKLLVFLNPQQNWE